MDKKFVRVPEGRFEKIMFSAIFSQSITGNKVTHQEIMETINEEKLVLTAEQLEELNESFPI